MFEKPENQDEIFDEIDQPIGRDYVAQVYLGAHGGKVTIERLRRRIDWFVANISGGTTLDMGCSEGILPILLGRKGFTVIGIDILPEAIAFAEKMLAEENEAVRTHVKFICGDALTTDFQAQSFDTVVIGEVIEHLTNPEQLIQRAKTLLKPSGRLLLTTPFGFLPHKDHKTIFTLGSLAGYLKDSFAPEEFFIQDGYLYFKGKNEQKPSAWGQLDERVLLSMTEAATISSQQFLYKHINSHQTTNKKLNENIEKIEAENATALHALDKKIDALTSKNKKLEDKNKELEGNIEEIEEAHAAAQRLLLKKIEEIEEAHAAEQRRLLKKNKALKSHNKKLHGKIAQINDSAPYRFLNSASKFIKRPTSANLRRFGSATLLVITKVGEKVFGRIFSKSDRFSAYSRKLKGPFTLADLPVCKYLPPPPQPPVRPVVAAILDNFSYECLKYEINLSLVHKESWQEEMVACRPDFLFVESAWQGNEGNWQYIFKNYAQRPDNPLCQLLKYCNANGIPTVFWNKEDPPNFDVFIDAAKDFDVIFTTDANCISKYQQICGHTHVYALPFAAQPRIHNPIGKKELKGLDIAFAGSWYKKHANRVAYAGPLFDAATRYNFFIFNRNSYRDDDRYSFPKEYKKFIHPSMDYESLLTLHRVFKIFLNTNSVVDSPTMFSRRVYEILASTTPVVSTPSIGMEEMFGSLIPVADDRRKAKSALKRLMRNQEYRMKLGHLGYREVMSHHTYEERVKTIYQTIGLQEASPCQSPKVSVITATNRPGNIKNIRTNFARQSYPNIELIIVLNSDSYQIDRVKSEFSDLKNVHVYQLPESCTLGECLNLGIDKMTGDYFAKMDDDDIYLKNYIYDLVLTFKYQKAEIAGKRTVYAFVEATNSLILRFPQQEHKYVKLITGATLFIKKSVFEKVRFPELHGSGTDTHFLEAAQAAGFRLYSADRYNYIVFRAKSLEEHIWRISPEQFCRNSIKVAKGLRTDIAEC